MENPRVEAEIDFMKIRELSSEQIMADAHDLYSRWLKMNTSERRRLIELLVKDITVGRDEITINLFYLPTFEELPTRQRIL